MLFHTSVLLLAVARGNGKYIVFGLNRTERTTIADIFNIIRCSKKNLNASRPSAIITLCFYSAI